MPPRATYSADTRPPGAAIRPTPTDESRRLASEGDVKRRILMYSHDGFGLGHLKRNANIAARFVREVPGSSVLMLVGASSGVYFHLPPGVDFIKVPSIVKVGTGMWSPRTLRITPDETRAIRAATIQKVAELFAPDLLLVDYLPTGVWGELLPTLQMLKGQRQPVKVILGLRDILDAPEVTRRLWRREGAYHAIRHYYDAVFIYGCPDIFATADRYGLADVARRIRYCGYVCSDESSATREQTRRELQISADRLVVVTGGGGYDAFPMMQTCMEAFKRLGKGAPCEAIVIAGPLMEPCQWESLRRQAEGLRVRVLHYTWDNSAVLGAADLVISMASYNTLVEAIGLRKRILAIPREGPSSEQRLRAEIFSGLGLVQAIWPEQLSASILADAIQLNLEARPGRAMSLNVDGASTVVREMATLLQLEAPEMVGVE